MRYIEQSNQADGTLEMEGSHRTFRIKQEKEKPSGPSKHPDQVVENIIEKQKGTLRNSKGSTSFQFQQKIRPKNIWRQNHYQKIVKWSFRNFRLQKGRIVWFQKVHRIPWQRYVFGKQGKFIIEFRFDQWWKAWKENIKKEAKTAFGLLWHWLNTNQTSIPLFFQIIKPHLLDGRFNSIRCPCQSSA